MCIAHGHLSISLPIYHKHDSFKRIYIDYFFDMTLYSKIYDIDKGVEISCHCQAFHTFGVMDKF